MFTDAYKPVISGVVNSLELFRQGLEAVHQPVKVFSPRFPGYVPDPAYEVRFPSVLLYKKAGLPFALPWTRTPWRKFLEFNPLLVHSQHPFWLGRVAYRYARRAGVPIVTTIHTQYDQFVHYLPLPQAFAKRLVNRLVLHYCHQVDAVITPSASMAQRLQDLGLQREIEVVPNPLDLGAFERPLHPEAVRARYGIAADEVVFGFIGRMAKEKNLETLLRAFSKVQAELGHTRLMLVGPGPYLEELQRLATRLPGGDKVIFTGPVPYEQVPDYFTALDVFVMTSTTEVQPLVLPEAMAAGTCLVAADAIGPRDVLKHEVTGLLCKPEEGAFVEAMLRVARQPDLRARLGAAAKAEAANYALPKATERLLAVYRKVLERFENSRGKV